MLCVTPGEIGNFWQIEELLKFSTFKADIDRLQRCDDEHSNGENTIFDAHSNGENTKIVGYKCQSTAPQLKPFQKPNTMKMIP